MMRGSIVIGTIKDVVARTSPPNGQMVVMGRDYWRWRSWPKGGRPKITEEICILIRRLADENPDWGAPRIHGELQKLGLSVSERSVARYLRKILRRGDPGKRWLAVLRISSACTESR